MAITAEPTQSVGDLFREWRERRGMSQLELALKADVSARHLSFVETGRSRPSRDMVLRLAEWLAVPLRERNTLLLAAGYAPVFRERPLDDVALSGARQAVARVLAGHEPYPAFAVNGRANIVISNRSMAPLFAGVGARLLEPPVNVVRLTLHPDGLAPRIANLAEWRHHLLSLVQRHFDVTGDAGLGALLDEVRGYPAPRERHTVANGEPRGVVPLRLMTEAGPLSLISTTTVFGMPLDVTLSELSIETFYPADKPSAEMLRRAGAIC
jgi:transcriptional regulator with XRE-family HTH domain